MCDCNRKSCGVSVDTDNVEHVMSKAIKIEETVIYKCQVQRCRVSSVTAGSRRAICRMTSAARSREHCVMRAIRPQRTPPPDRQHQLSRRPCTSRARRNSRCSLMQRHLKARETERAAAEMQVHTERLREAEGLTESRSSRSLRRNMHQQLDEPQLSCRRHAARGAGGACTARQNEWRSSVRVVSKSWKLRQEPRPSEERSSKRSSSCKCEPKRHTRRSSRGRRFEHGSWTPCRKNSEGLRYLVRTRISNFNEALVDVRSLSQREARYSDRRVRTGCCGSARDARTSSR